jgi:hypothetical protein
VPRWRFCTKPSVIEVIRNGIPTYRSGIIEQNNYMK